MAAKNAKTDRPDKLPTPIIKVIFEQKPGKLKPDPYAGLELLAEFLFCHVYGQKKYGHKADYFRDAKYFKQQIKKLIQHLSADIDKLQASEIFISRAKLDLEQLESELFRGEFTKEKQKIAILSLRPITTFLGYGTGSNKKTLEPYFIPSVWSEMHGWNDPGAYYKHIKGLRVDYRIQIARQLRDQGLKQTEIAEVMNQSVYRVTQWLNTTKKKEGNKS